MRNSFEFKECERFLKRVLKDRGMFTKGAVIAFLITGGIGFLGGHTVEAAQAGVIGNPHSGGTTIDYHWAGTDLLTHESIVFAPVTDDNVGTTAERFQGIYNRQAFNSVIIGGHAWAAGSNLSRKYLDNPSTYKPAQQTVIGNNATGIGGQATAVGSGTFAMDQATAVGNDVMAVGASSIAIGNDDISEKYKDTMTDKIVKSIYGDGESDNKDKQGIFREVEFIDSKGTKRTRTSLDPSGYNTLRSWNWFKSSYMTDNSSSAGGEDTHIYSPTMSRGIGSIAIGSRSIAKSDGSTAIGTLAFALGEGSTAMGLRAYTGEEAPGAVAIGEESRSFAAQSLAVGNHNESSEQGAMSYGYSAKAAGIGSLAIGYHTYANTEFGTNAGAAALISGVQGVNAPLTSAQQTAWDNYVAKASAYYTEVEKYPKDPDVQGSVVAAKTAMDTAYTQLTATGFSVPNVANLTYIADGQAGNKNKSTEVTNKIKALQTGAANIDTKKGTDIYLTTKNSDGTKNEVKKTVAKGANSIAIGYYSVATANSSIAQGAGTVAEGGSSIALGSLASTTDTATNSISIGVASSVKKENSIALGTQSSVYGAGSVALGAGSRVYNTNSMAMGYGSTVMAANSTAIGVGSKIDFGSGNAQAIGTNAVINKNSGNSLAFGNKSTIGENSVNTVAQGFKSTIGTGAYNSMAIGAYASIGDNAKSSFAMGTTASVAANARSSMALGEGSYVNKDQSIAIGRNARAEFANSVALGFQSTTHYYGNPTTREANVSETESATNVHGLTVGAYLPEGSKLADKLAKLDATAAGYVSVGGWTEEKEVTNKDGTKSTETLVGLRRIVNVAPGALDTDAVTVAQLRDWTDKTAHFLSISGASGKSSTNFGAESWAIDGKDRNNNTIGTLTIKGNFENEGASTVDRGLAVGAYANALGNRSVAIADHAVAKGNQAIAMGQNSFILGENSTAVGSYATAFADNAIAMGVDSTIGEVTRDLTGDEKTNPSYKRITAVGRSNQSSIAIGFGTNVNADRAIALGVNARVVPVKATGAKGATTYTEAHSSIAIGQNAAVTGAQHSIALGENSEVIASDVATPTTAAFTGETNTDPGNGVLSVGSTNNSMNITRRIIHVSGGSDDYDAVNVKQLKKATAYYSVNSTESADKAVNGIASVKSNVNNDGAIGRYSVAIGSYANANKESGVALGREVVTQGEKGVGLGYAVVSRGDEAVAIGSVARAYGANSIALGKSAQVGTATTESDGTVTYGEVKHAIAIGNGANVEAGQGGVALGWASKVTAADVVNAPANAVSPYLLTTGTAAEIAYDYSNDKGNGVVSFGTRRNSTDATTTFARRLTGVAGGINDYDAVNVKQLKALETNERHIKAKTGNDAYTPDASGNVTLNYVNGRGEDVTDTTVIKDVAKKSDEWKLAVQSGKATTGTAVVPKGSTTKQVTLKEGTNITLATDAATGTVTISAAGGITSVTSGNTNALTVSTTSGAVTVTPVLAGAVSTAGDANKLVTAGVVKTAIDPLATRSLNNITDDGKKVITGLGTIVAAGDRVTLKTTTDNTTGQKTYTLSADKQVESVEKATAASGDENIATVNVKTGGTAGAANATYQVGVSKSKVAEIAQAAVTVESDSSNVTVTPDTSVTGVKKYKISVTKDVFASGTNTTKAGTGTATDPYKYNLNEALTDMASIAGKGGTNTFKISNGGAVMTFNDATTGKNAKAANITVNNINITGLQDAALTATSTDAVTGKQLYATNTNVTNLTNTVNGHTTAINTLNTTVEKAITFKGNDTQGINKKLGETLEVTGEGTYTAAPTTAAGNIYTKQVVDGNNKKLEIGLASDLKNISSVSSKENAGKSTKVALGDDGLTVTNKQGAATTDTTTITIGKDGINAGGKNVTAVNEVDAKSVKANTVTAGKANSSGTANDGVDGKVTVTGKNGSAVELNGATGGLTLTTVNGTATNTVSIKTKEGSGPIVGESGAAAPTNMSRLVYTTNVNGTDTEFEVATMKDGVKYAGDDVTATDKSKVIAKKLNETVDIVGGGTTTNLTTNNIGVVNDNGKLNVRLSKVVTGMTSITAGNTVVNTTSVTVSGTGTNTNKTILDATGTTVTDGATNGKTTTTTVDGLKVINNTKGAQIGAELIRINGTKGTGDTVTDGIAIGNQTVTATKNDATTEANTGNYITGLDNKAWDLDTKGYVSGRAATEDQLKVLSDKISLKSASDYRLIANPTAGSGGEYTLNANGKIELTVQDASNPTSVNTITIKNVANKDELDKLKEAKTIIFVDADGDEVFKQTDGTFKKANKQPAHGDVVTKVNTTAATPITNVKSIVENTTATGTNPDYIDKLNATVADATNGTKNKTTAVNVSDLQKTAAAIIDRGITFQGNDGKDIKKGLGQTLNIVGEGSYGTPAAAPNTAAGNIFTKENGGNLEIGLAKDLQNISSITNTKPDGSKSTKLELGDDELKVINTQGTGATATTTKVTIGKDGINADGKNVTNVNEVDATSVKANTVTVGKENPTGTTTGGVDGTVTVTGANGSAVEIKGADGSITVYGANGSNKASFKTKEVEGVLGADVKVGDTKPNMTRFVYETANPDGSATPITHVVATMDDGMKYSGDDHEASTATATEKHVVTRKLNERLEIVGGAKTNLTNNNIGVINNGDTGKLTVKLSKNLKEIETIANVADPTDTTKPSTVMTLSNDGVTFKNTQAPTTAGGKATTSTVEIKKDGVTEFKTNDGTNDGNTVTINGKTGTIATGNTVVNTTSVTVSGTGTAKTTLDASGTTVTDGKANGKSVVTTVDGTTVTDGTHTTSTTATGITISPSAVAGKTVSLTNAGLNNGGNRITDVADPIADTDAANKQYVDARTKLRYKANTVEPDVPGVAKANHEINILDGVLNIEGVTDQVVTTASKDGKITVGLAPAVTKKLDQLAATTSDGRDNKLGSEANAIASTGIATADGINGQNVTYKVNALRHGEAGSVVFTDEDGNRLVKATDGKYYKATDVNPDGTVKATPAGGTAPVGLDLLGADKDKAYSSLVSPDGKTTGAASVLNNVGSALSRILPTLDTNADKTKFLDKLDKATEAGSKVAHAAVNVTDLKNTSDAIIAKGIDFKGNTGTAIHKNLGETLNIVGEGTAPTTTAANNIATKRNANGDLEIGLAKDLQGITLVSNTNDTTKPSSKMELTDDGVTLTNTQPVAGGTAETSKATIGKDGKTTFENSTAPNNTVEIDSKKGTITVGKDTDKQVVVNGKDGKITTGKTEVNGAEVIVKDGKNFTKINTGGTTITDGTNTTVVGANGITITPSNVAGKVVSLTNEGLNNGGNRITNVADPTDDTDAANKQYVDARTKLRYKADTTVDDAGAAVTNHEINLLDGTLEITGTADKVVTKATKDGKINIDLADAVKKKLDQLDAKNSDGRDGKTGNETGAIAKDGLTKADGLNEKTTTYKVNALRHGEAGSVVYTDDEGHRLVKAVDGKYHRAEAVNADGTLKAAADLPSGVTLDAVDNPQARVVNVDGTTTSPTVFGNVASPVEKLTAKDDAGVDLDDQTYLNKLKTASKTNASKFAAVNATDLYTTAKEILAKGMNFVGNDEAVNVHRDLGATLKVQGADNYTRGANDSNTSNILVKANAAANGDGLNISLAKDLQGITSITNTDGTKDATGTKLEIGNDGLTVTNTQAGTPAAGTTPATPAKTSTMTVGKDGKTTFTNSENPNNAIEINSKEGTITAGTADDKKVTINGKDGKITTGHTVVNGSSVTITDDNNNKTETTATGTTVTDGNNNKTVTAATGVTVTDGTNTATYTATTSKISDGANKSVETTASGTTITNGNVTTTATAGNTEYKNGNNVTTVNTNGMTVKDGTSTATHTAGSTMFEDGNNSAIYSANGSTIADDTSSATHTASGSTFTEGNNTAKHTATGSSYDDGTNHFELGATGIRINSDNGGTVSINSSGLNNGGNTITHVGDGVADTDAVNVKQLKANKVSLTVNDNNAATTNHNLVLTPSTDAKDKHTNYDVKLADTVTLGTAANAVTVDGTNGTIKAGKDANAVTVDGTKASITAGKDGNAVTVDGTKASITAGTGANAITADGTNATLVVGGTGAATDSTNKVTINGTDGTIKTGKTEVSGSAVTITDATNDAKKTTVDATGTTVTDGVANGKKVVTTAESVTVADGTTKTTTKAGETKYEANGKDLTVKTEGITVTDGNNTGSINAMNSTFTNATNGTQVGATLIRVNGEKAADGTVSNKGIAIGNQTVTTTEIGEAPNTTTKTETGNFITGLDNKTWDPKTNGIVSGRAATEDQLKVVDDKVNKGRVFSADTLDANKKAVEAMVGLGDTLSIVGGAKMDELTDNNIGVELKAAETKDGVTTPTTMTVKLAKKVNMADGSTTYTKDVTDKAGKKVGVRTGVMDGESMKYTLYNVDAAGNIITDAKGNKDVNVSTSITSGGIVIAPKDSLTSKTVELSHEGLNNGGHRITNVADGVAMNDAATVGQLKSSTTTIINHANTIGAHAAALAAMNPLSFDPMRKSQVMAGIGSYRGKQALALGVAHYTSENFIFNIGMSVGHNEHMMNAGMTYRFGGNPSMIPDRYKGGPISSIYVMQDELSAFKEENARQKEQLKELPELKQEVAELRAMVQQLLAAQGK